MTIHTAFIPVLLCGLAGCGNAAQGEIEVIRGTSVERLAMASTKGVPTQLVIREVRVKTPLPGGRNHHGELIIGHDANSGFAWWILHNDYNSRLGESVEWFAAHSATAILDDRAVVFWDVNPGSLFASEVRSLTAASPDEAQQKVMDEIRQHAGELEGHGQWRRSHFIDIQLPPEVPLDFWVRPGESFLRSPPATRITSAVREGKTWKLLVKDRWTMEVILDDSYKFVSFRRLDPAPGLDK